MTRVVLIDDEPLARTIVKEYLAAFPEFEVVQECNDGFEGVKAISTHKPDLVFLDVQMPKINGFEMLELIEEPPAVIFTTAFDEFAMKAFEAHAVDYLLKPFSKDRFKKAISKWKVSKQIENSQSAAALLENTVQPEERNRIVVKKGNNIVILPVQTIHYFEAFDDYVKIHTKEGFHLKKKTMSHFESVLDPAVFIRAHRSYILNLQELTRIEPLEKDTHVALLKSG
ncbi:MAG: LytR/AlgR family response regulator transcription factor, partial [Bacteroidota bacterium]